MDLDVGGRVEGAGARAGRVGAAASPEAQGTALELQLLRARRSREPLAPESLAAREVADVAVVSVAWCWSLEALAAPVRWG